MLKNARDTTVSVRINAVMSARLARVTDRTTNPLAPTPSRVMLRGLELALTELEKPARKRNLAAPS